MALRSAGDEGRVIVHIDMDCFYAQVEMVTQPKLCSQPLGIQQKTILATTNYIARNKGVGKMDNIKRARQICPDLIIIKGEILTPFRAASEAIFSLLKATLPGIPVQRMGLDEFFLDVTDVVSSAHSSSYSSSCSCLALLEASTPDDAWTCKCPYHRLWRAPAPQLDLGACAGATHDAQRGVQTHGAAISDSVDQAPILCSAARPLVEAAVRDPGTHTRLQHSVRALLPSRGGGVAWYGHVKGVRLQGGSHASVPPQPPPLPCATNGGMGVPAVVAHEKHAAGAGIKGRAQRGLGSDVVNNLAVGTHVAARLRRLIFTRLGYTSCAGVAHNKALAKVAGELHKPNQQTCVLPWMATSVLDQHGIRKVPGIGRATRRKLESGGISSLPQIRSTPHRQLAALLGDKEARAVADLAQGIDKSAVTMSGPPKSLSNEDNIGRCTDVTTLVVRLEPLIRLLLSRVDDDFQLYSRYPTTLRFSICGARYRDRRSRQRDIPPAVFQMGDKEARTQRVVDMCLGLLWKMVKRPFVVSVITAGFTNFAAHATRSLPSLFSRGPDVPSASSGPQAARSTAKQRPPYGSRGSEHPHGDKRCEHAGDGGDSTDDHGPEKEKEQSGCRCHATRGMVSRTCVASARSCTQSGLSALSCCHSADPEQPFKRAKKASRMQASTSADSAAFDDTSSAEAVSLWSNPSDLEQDEDTFQCDVCGVVLPLFCFDAHAQFHHLNTDNEDTCDGDG